MFDVGFTELVLLFVIGLLILGPERLPRVASQLGRWVARARRTANQLRHQLEREVALDEMTRSQRKRTHGSAASSARPGEPDSGNGPAAAGTEAPGEPDPGAEAPAAADSGAGEAAPASAPGGTKGGPARDEAGAAREEPGAAPAADDAAGPDAEGAAPPDRSSQA